MEVVGGINKKGHVFGLGFQAATIKSSQKISFSNDASSSEEVSPLKDQVQTLTNQLQQKTLEQEKEDDDDIGIEGDNDINKEEEETIGMEEDDVDMEGEDGI
ncbi:hypothetical protein RYX36_024250 [Vicia faba]